MADKSKALAIKLALYKFRVGSLSGKRPTFSSGLPVRKGKGRSL